MATEAIFLRACAKLRSAVGDEAVVRWNFTSDLREMLDALEFIQPGLEEAEMRTWRGNTSSLLMNWLKEATQAAYRIMDMVDELQDMRPAATTMSRMLPYLAIKKNAMSTKVEELKNQMIWLKQYWRTYVCEDEDTIPQQPRVINERTTVPSFEEASIIGRGVDKQRIVSVLISAASNITNEPTSCIILPIFGLAGSGKTTLAKMVFNDTNSFLQEYNFRVWVHVWPKFDTHKICECIISQAVSRGGVQEEINDYGFNSGRYLMRLHKLLDGKKVLLVLDDLWEQDSNQLQLLKFMLTSLGDKVDVIVTTCNQAIARKICTVEPYRLTPLGDDACWGIIEKSIRLQEDDEELEKIGRKIARKCCGVPSVAGAYAGMLHSRDPTRWEEVLERNIWRCCFGVDSASLSLLSAFGLSYMSMPPELRLCFDYYCAIFPDGHNIVKDDLIHQWTALDLIEPSEMLSTTQIAEVYITTLLDISFLQIAKLDNASGKDDNGAILFTVHGLAHNFARWFTLLEYIYDDSIPIRRVHYRLATGGRGDLFDGDDDYLRALRCVDCSEVKFNDDSFSFMRCLRVLELTESSVQKLPDSIWQLRHLGYLKISEFSRLVALPESFGYLNNLFHIDLSGCSGLINLPESFGKLIRLVHVNLSGCFSLATLPESFGDLMNLSHVNLSRCHGLAEFPKLLQKLGKLVHLDLSFWSSFEGIGKGLGGLTNLEHLNLSHSCSHLPRHHSQGLKEALCKLTNLRYLNLSMCLNPIFYYHQSQEVSLQYIGDCLKGLSSLEHLDLSHNTFLFDLPESLGQLNKLHTLNLSGCIRLKKIGEIKSLKFMTQRNCRGLESCHFVVRADDDAPYSSSNIVQLEDINCQELHVSCLEKLKSMEEAQSIRLVEKQKVEILKLYWSVGAARGYVNVEDSALLEELVPPRSLQCLEIHGYGGKTCQPAWRIPSISSHLSNLMEVTLQDFPRCTVLPPLGLLPNLERLVLRRMASIARIDDIDLSGGNRAAFSRLSKVTIDDMQNLKVFLFPGLAELVIQKCPELSFGPLPPRAHRLVISDCNKMMRSWGKREGNDEKRSSSSTPVTQLVVESCNLPRGDSSLLHHLSSLRSLTFKNCDNIITSSTEFIQALSSLQSLCFSHCKGMLSLPEHFGDLTSLRELTIQSCHGMTSLLESMHDLTSLRHLYILDCPELKKWCESEENETKLADIRPKYEKLGASTTA